MNLKNIILFVYAIHSFSCKKEISNKIYCNQQILSFTFSIKFADKVTNRLIHRNELDSFVLGNYFWHNQNFLTDFYIEDTSYHFLMFNTGNDTIFLKYRSLIKYDTLIPIYESYKDECNITRFKFHKLYHNRKVVSNNIIHL